MNLDELRQALARGELTGHEAIAAWMAIRETPWRTKAWKDRRSEVLKGACEQCGGKEDLVIQHLVHPNSPWDYYSDFRREAFERWLRQPTQASRPPPMLRTVSRICPACDHRGHKIAERKTKRPKWICRQCRYEFDHDPEEEVSMHLDREEANRQRRRGWEQFEVVCADQIEELKLEAVRRAIPELARHLALHPDDTETWCKPCADGHDLPVRDGGWADLKKRTRDTAVGRAEDAARETRERIKAKLAAMRRAFE